MSDVITKHGLGSIVQVDLQAPQGSTKAFGSFHPPFDEVKDLLCERPCQRPSRFSPLRTLTDAELRALAQRHSAPDEWRTSDEECPF